MKQRKWKNNLDEMQEQKLLQIEHNGCWLSFWGLVIVVFVQFFLYGPEGKNLILGEWIVFMCLALYIVIACIRHGIWDRHIPASPKTNLLCGVIAGTIGGIFRAAVAYKVNHNLYGAVKTGLIIFMLTFLACFIGMSLIAVLYHKKVDKIENAEEENPYKQIKDKQMKDGE